jgi:hypothetical protein
MALVEIDVLVAQAIGLTLEELTLIYLLHFPVLQQVERDTWYDMRGRIVFTASKALVGIGLPRGGKKGSEVTITCPDGLTKTGRYGWDDIRLMQDNGDLPTGSSIETTGFDDTLPNGQQKRALRWTAPFVCADRETDYRIAWEFFARERSQRMEH